MEEIASFLRDRKIPPLKQTFAVVLLGFGITMLGFLLYKYPRCDFQKHGNRAFLFRQSGSGRGFTLPLLDETFTWLANANKEFVFTPLYNFTLKFWLDEFRLSILILVVPLVEEIEWRGFFWLTWRRHSDGKWWNIAFFASVILFALYHQRGIAYTIGPFAVAIVNWVLLKRTGRLWPCIVNHSLFNAQVVLDIMAYEALGI